MKERSNSNQKNANLNSSNSTTGTSNLSNTSNLSSSDSANSSADPYNSNNFMAPPIGAQIRCVTCLGNNVQGKVIAYDQQTKMLALRSSIPNKPGYYDYSMVNVSWCSNLEVIEEPSESPEPLTTLNIQKLERRKKLNIDNKYKEINSLGENVSSLAQHLYFTIYKTLNEVEWEGKNIVVMNSVVITPPYDVNSCQTRNNETNTALEHVKKIVKKFNEDYIVHQANLSNQSNQTNQA